MKEVSGQAARVSLYDAHSQACAAKLEQLWHELETPADQRELELADTNARALKVWDEAVTQAEGQQAAVHTAIGRAVEEVSQIKQQLGEVDADVSEVVEAGRTLQSHYAEVQTDLEVWRQRKVVRLQEHDELKAKINSVKTRLGQKHDLAPPATKRGPGRLDISQSALEFLQLELDKLHAEQGRRERSLDAAMGRLRKVCIELGEDDAAVAAEAHPSLQHYRDALPSFASYSTNAAPPAQHGADEGADAVDLSDSTFKALELKINQLHDLKARREERAGELMGVLESLWTALDVAEDDVDRAIFARLMAGPARLHGKSIEKCVEEVGRLESCKAALMRELIVSNWRQLQDVCTRSHLALPAMPALFNEALTDIDITQSGQVSDVLAKVVRQLADTTAEAERRQDVLAAVAEFDTAYADCAWLTAYENDDMRYKGRDANRNLQKAIKASKTRAAMPAMIAQMRQVLQAWQAAEGRPFVYDGLDYQSEVLDAVAAELEREAEEKLKQHQDKKQVGKKATSGKSRPPTQGGSARKPTLAGQAGTPRTPAVGLGSRPPSRGGLENTTPASAKGEAHPRRPSTASATTPGGFSGPLQDKLNRLLHASTTPTALLARPHSAGGPHSPTDSSSTPAKTPANTPSGAQRATPDCDSGRFGRSGSSVRHVHIPTPMPGSRSSGLRINSPVFRPQNARVDSGLKRSTSSNSNQRHSPFNNHMPEYSIMIPEHSGRYTPTQSPMGATPAPTPIGELTEHNSF
ncbi:hypothetical protein WJX72_001222 [[Myrmecia] bisecta]|uniref:Microtubule associated protein n=1 Tax=[Myrmecia] bisecta TaxID=41462 RepID=A0AAW1P1C8_9CHLO